MKSIIYIARELDSNIRRMLVMALDVVMILVAMPLALLLSSSILSFDPFSFRGVMVWVCIGLSSHIIFRLGGLYDTVWRFASTPDFFNIIKSCLVLVVGLYAVTLAVRFSMPVTGLNERQFVCLFLIAFALISAPRLGYRYLREGAGWRARRRDPDHPRKRAIFVGELSRSDVIIRAARSGSVEDMQIVGIVATDSQAAVGRRIQGVPVLAARPRLADVLDEYLKGTQSVDVLVFAEGVEKQLQEFSEIVRVARQNSVAVLQFSSISRPRNGGELALEAVEMETILRRATVPTDVGRLRGFLEGKRVLVTGGAGSIGRTLVKRSMELGAEAVLVADISEIAIFRLTDEINPVHRSRLTCRILDITDRQLLTRAVRDFEPDIIFHAAALKHLPLLEENWVSAIKTNIFGTLACAEVAATCNVRQVVLISSDKAAEPTSVLGLTKRVAEQIVNAMHLATHSPANRNGNGNGTVGDTIFTAVRFGNVFGSDGSVATVFERQIREGGPVTITHHAMTRYMMTVGEAVDLVMMSALDSSQRTVVDDYGTYMLEMGEPVSIVEVAETMIRLAGKKPYSDIAIEFIGMRPGEKLHETLTASDEQLVDVDVPHVFGLKSHVFEMQHVKSTLSDLREAAAKDSKPDAINVMKGLCCSKQAIPESSSARPPELRANQSA